VVLLLPPGRVAPAHRSRSSAAVTARRRWQQLRWRERLLLRWRRQQLPSPSAASLTLALIGG
jgi:hypothetical protein